MTDNKHHTLSEYQKAALAHMGIALWQQNSDASVAVEPEIKVSEQPVVTETPNPEMAASIQPDAREDADAAELGQPETVQPEVVDITDKILLCLPQEMANHVLVKDVLHTMQLDDNECLVVENGVVEGYQGFRLAWCIGDNLGMQDKVLVTPPLASLQQSSAKRALWQILCQ